MRLFKLSYVTIPFLGPLALLSLGCFAHKNETKINDQQGTFTSASGAAVTVKASYGPGSQTERFVLEPGPARLTLRTTEYSGTVSTSASCTETVLLYSGGPTATQAIGLETACPFLDMVDGKAPIHPMNMTFDHQFEYRERIEDGRLILSYVLYKIGAAGEEVGRFEFTQR